MLRSEIFENFEFLWINNCGFLQREFIADILEITKTKVGKKGLTDEQFMTMIWAYRQSEVNRKTPLDVENIRDSGLLQNVIRVRNTVKRMKKLCELNPGLRIWDAVNLRVVA